LNGRVVAATRGGKLGLGRARQRFGEDVNELHCGAPERFDEVIDAAIERPAQGRAEPGRAPTCYI
jgi:hypothetical protein